MATDNSIGDNYAPNWLPYFSLDGDIFCDFDVECQICNKRLAITELADGEDIEDFCVLPCGHAFGYPLVHSRCGHSFVPKRVELSDGSNMHKAVSECVIAREGLLPECGHHHCTHHAREAASQRHSRQPDSRQRDSRRSYSRQPPRFEDVNYNSSSSRHRNSRSDHSPPTSPGSRSRVPTVRINVHMGDRTEHLTPQERASIVEAAARHMAEHPRRR
ncbi:hypothetical protein CHU98_g1737 [Xylaria longipes]|nr:hypothetical protein CHU98_g1737 [Xylaria longipes]